MGGPTSSGAGGGGGEANEELVEQVAELRKLVQRQEELLASAGISAAAAAEQAAVDHGLVGTPEQPPVVGRTAPQGGRSYGRAISMSGIDVWGDMALGDMNELSRAGAPETQPDMPPPPVAHSSTEGFSFSQPDTMPPR